MQQIIAFDNSKTSDHYSFQRVFERFVHGLNGAVGFMKILIFIHRQNQVTGID